MKFDIICGEYRHFKGMPYTVFGSAIGDNGDKYVIYRHDYGTMEFWIRPLNMFTEIIERDGKTMQRFYLVREVPADISFNKLRDILGEKTVVLNHSETLEKYVISSTDSITGEILIAKYISEE